MLNLAYLGLGANLGDPIQQLIDAREAIRRVPEIEALRCSSFYSSSPVGYDAQPDFINCVIELRTRAAPCELLDHMQLIESKLGRERVIDNQNAPRLIDIDLLLYGDEQIDCERLIVPHPRMKTRLFVIEPLLELVELAYYRQALNQGLENGEFEGQILTKLAII